MKFRTLKKRSNLRIIGIKRRNSGNRHKNILNKIFEEIFLTKKVVSVDVQDLYRTPHTLDQKIKSQCHTFFKTLNIQKKEY